MLCSLLLGFCVALTSAGPANAGTVREYRLLNRINDSRAAYGLAPLRLGRKLSTYAESHSAAMSSQAALFHTRSFSSLCCWSSISENVAVASTVRQVHRNLMGSPGHRANILDPNKRVVGLGVVKSSGRLWVTEVFRQPR